MKQSIILSDWLFGDDVALQDEAKQREWIDPQKKSKRKKQPRVSSTLPPGQVH